MRWRKALQPECLLECLELLHLLHEPHAPWFYTTSKQQLFYLALKFYALWTSSILRTYAEGLSG